MQRYLVPVSCNSTPGPWPPPLFRFIVYVVELNGNLCWPEQGVTCNSLKNSAEALQGSTRVRGVQREAAVGWVGLSFQVLEPQNRPCDAGLWGAPGSSGHDHLRASPSAYCGQVSTTQERTCGKKHHGKVASVSWEVLTQVALGPICVS